jgi:uncharacterized protein
MLVNIIKSYRTTVTICDSDLIGKTFQEGKAQLDIKESFYKGEEKTPEQAEEIIKGFIQEDATFNIAGKESINLALKIGMINQQGIKTVQSVPFALVLL